MTDTQDQTHDTTAAPEVDDFDVEGHGLREVAIGVSAATLLASGSGAALSAAGGNPLERTIEAIGGLVTAVQEDVREVAGDVGSAAGDAVELALGKAGEAHGTASSTVDDTAATAGKTVADTSAEAGRLADGAKAEAGKTVNQAEHLARETLGDVLETVRPAAQNPIGWSDAVVDQSLSDVREIRDGALATATTTVSETTEGAGRLVDRTVATAEQVVASVPGTVDRTLTAVDETVADTVGTVHETAGLGVETQTEGGTGATVHVAGKSASVSLG